MTRRISQLSFANRAICIVLSALLAITMMPASAFAAMGDYAGSAADAQQQSASEFTGSEDQSQQSQQEQPAGESTDAENVPPDNNSSAASQGNLSMQDEGEGEQSEEAADEPTEQPNPVDALLDVHPADLGGEYVSDEVIIVYEDEAIGQDQPIELEGADKTVALSDLGVKAQEAIVPDEESQKTGDVVLAKIEDDKPVEVAISQIAQLPGVLSVQPNYVYRLSGEPKTFKTNDPDASEQYYLYRTNSSPAWHTVKTSNSVTVAVIDSGCDLAHPDLKANLLTDLAWDCVDNCSLSTSAVQDSKGHGTQVCGVVAAKANNSVGIAGASYDANILPLKVFDDSGEATTDTLVVALKKVADYAKAGSARNLKVVNMSLGSYASDSQVHAWIQTLRNQYGINIVCAGGNGDGKSTPYTAPSYPSDYDECISVTSLTPGGVHSKWSDYNAYKDISAPGEEIYTTNRGGGYVTVAGTSFSAPIVSGIVAMLVAAKPSVNPSQVYQAICNSATSILGASRPGSSGAVNALGALEQLGVNTSASYYSDMNFTVDYSAPIKCNTPTKFNINATGGSGTFKYRLDTIYLRGEDDYFLVDPSKGSGYLNSSTLEFTFMASGTYDAEFWVMDMDTRASKRKTIRITVNDPDYPSVEEKADAVAAECNGKNFDTDYDKALWLHDWIIDHCSYDGTERYCHSEGALARGVGTCESYHRAYSMLLRRVGIDTGRMEGNGHVWTAVKMGDKWYQVDATWDDIDYEPHSQFPEERHLYFGLTDTLIGFAHSDHKGPVSGYESNSFEDNYLVRNGAIKNYSSVYLSAIQQKLDEGAYSFNIAGANSTWPASLSKAKEIVNRIVAYDLGSNAYSTRGKKAQITASYSNGMFAIRAIVDGEPDSYDFYPGFSTQTGALRYGKANGRYAQSEWLTINGKTYYFGPDGIPVRYQQTIEGKTYLFWSDCSLARNVMWNERIYGSDGAMLKGSWTDFNGRRYYAKDDGQLARYATEVGGKTYLFWSDCSLARNQIYGGRHYGLDGAMSASAWVDFNGRRYYAKDDGQLARYATEVGGKTYLFWSDCSLARNVMWNERIYGSDGAMLKGSWADFNGRRYYAKDDGALAKYVNVIGGKTYLFWSDCSLARNVVWNGRTYGPDGAML